MPITPLHDRIKRYPTTYIGKSCWPDPRPPVIVMSKTTSAPERCLRSPMATRLSKVSTPLRPISMCGDPDDARPCWLISFSTSHDADPMSCCPRSTARLVLWLDHCIIGTSGAYSHQDLNERVDQADMLIQRLQCEKSTAIQRS
jgi:hypothetical protein